MKIPSLINDYKTQFSDSERNKIPLLKWHYRYFCKKAVYGYEGYSYLVYDSLDQERKWSFFGLCKQLARNAT
jgi:hypothetical protein